MAATFRSKDRAEVARFCRDLVARGFRQVPAIHELRQPAFLEFRIYRVRSWWRVAYYEPTLDGPLKPIPPDPAPPVKPYGYGGRAAVRSTRCRCGCSRPVEVRGLARTCYARWRYWNRDGVRDRELERAREDRAERKAAP
jgi:hypothetical protein